MKKTLGKSAAVAAVAGAGLLGASQASADTYVVAPGDSFYSIASATGMDPYQLAADNGMGIYDLIVPGQELQVTSGQVASSTAAGAGSYTVVEGDSFAAIAAAYGVTPEAVAQANGLSIYSFIFPGQVLQLPEGASAVAAAPVVENPTVLPVGYQIPGMEYEAGNTYPVGQCTWGVKKLTGWAGDFWGNAKDWAANAQAAGFAVGYTPVPGAIAVWTSGGGGYGHVAYVTDVQSDTSIQVLEANYNGNQAIGNYRGWFNPQATWDGAAIYIYPNA